MRIRVRAAGDLAAWKDRAMRRTHRDVRAGDPRYGLRQAPGSVHIVHGREVSLAYLPGNATAHSPRRRSGSTKALSDVATDR
jgi:hypothetical protein